MNGKTERLYVRVTPKAKQELNKKADQKKITISELIRNVLHKYLNLNR